MISFAFSIFILGALVAGGVYYWYVLRPKWHDLPALRDFYAKVDAVEGCFWAKVKARVVGYRTALSLILAELCLTIPDIFHEVLTQLSGFDWSPFVGDSWAKKLAQLVLLFSIVFNAIRKGAMGDKPAPTTQ